MDSTARTTHTVLAQGSPLPHGAYSQPPIPTCLLSSLPPSLPACLRYRTKKREEVSVLSGEVLVLHDYASTLKRLLERVQSGLYPIRQAAARFTIEIPKADKPPREVGVG